MTQLLPHIEFGPAWFGNEDNTLFARGYLIDTSGKIYQGKDILTYFSPVSEEAAWVHSLQHADGNFSVVWHRGTDTFAAVDRLRSFPLVFCQVAGTYFLSARSDQLPGDKTLDHVQAQLFPSACHTLGNATLWKEIIGLCAGEYVHFHSEGYEIKTYAAPFGSPAPLSKQTAPEQFQRQAMDTFKQILNSTGSRPLVIPLSGGFDSRFIAAMLKRMGKEQVSCFTYGRPDSYEVAISQKVARKLGYEWHFVPYTGQLLSTYLSTAGQRYQAFAANGISVAHEQDFFAIQVLLDSGKISPEAVVLPGFGGDVLAGSWLPPENDFSEDKRSLAHYLLKSNKFFAGSIQPNLPEQTMDLILAELGSWNTYNGYNMIHALHYWGIRNRMSKFLVNAVRIYDFWGLEWRLPFFEKGWMEFWQQVPLAQKDEKQFYLSCLKAWLFQPMGMDFEVPHKTPSWKAKIKKWLPTPAVQDLKKYFVNRASIDVNNQDGLSRAICQQRGWDLKLMEQYDLNYLMGKAYLEVMDLQ
ncbi:MAG: asparagine synthase-related protein [Bacteroidota bacterium]